MSTPLQPAKPEDVGLSTAALGRLSAALQERIGGAICPVRSLSSPATARSLNFEAFGARDSGQWRAMAKDTIFRIYSMTKPIVFGGVMMLWKEGRLLLNDPIEKYLPPFASPKVGLWRASRCGWCGEPLDHGAGFAAAYVRPDL